MAKKREKGEVIYSNSCDQLPAEKKLELWAKGGMK